jgi:hypothetical protein
MGEGVRGDQPGNGGRKEPIQVFPRVSGMQDEKMPRAMTDRERWFHVVADEYRAHNAAPDRLAKRLSSPETAARELAFRSEA